MYITATASFSFLKAVSSFTISLSFSNASVLYTYFPCTCACESAVVMLV